MCCFSEWDDEESDPSTYKQCKLQRGFTFQTTWIPEKYAVLGKTVRIKVNDEWQTGWEVIGVYRTVKTGNDLSAIWGQSPILHVWKNRDKMYRQAQARLDAKYAR